ncbi:hypothetical protein ACTQYZ_04600 [Anaerofustis sp. LCP19S3_F7]
MTKDDIYNLYKIIYAIDEDFHFLLKDILEPDNFDIEVFYYADFEKTQ